MARRPPGSEVSWHEAALRFRRALEVLEWKVKHCLPGERGPCGGTDAQHVAAYLGALRAVVEFRLSHLHLGDVGEQWAERAYEDVRAELADLESMRPCGREH